MKMVEYEVTVFTSNRLTSTTLNNIFIKLVGTGGESERKLLRSLRGASAFVTGAVGRFTVSCPTSIGKLVMIEVDKQPLPLFSEDSWFPAKVEVKSPEGDLFTFPIYRWITDRSTYRFREGTALRIFEDLSELGRYSREQELEQRHKDYCWNVYAEGIPHCMKADNPKSLPCEVRFSFTKKTEFLFTATAGLTELKLKGLADCKKGWTNLDDIDRVFCCKKAKMTDYVQEHWREDAFFGFQFLNGVDPKMIRRCTALPSNFPVTDSMVFPDGQGSLAEEMQKGHIFLCDYKNVDGVKTNIINGKQQYLMAPLVLLQKTPDDKLMPIAIQRKIYISERVYAVEAAVEPHAGSECQTKNMNLLLEKSKQTINKKKLFSFMSSP